MLPNWQKHSLAISMSGLSTACQCTRFAIHVLGYNNAQAAWKHGGSCCQWHASFLWLRLLHGGGIAISAGCECNKNSVLVCQHRAHGAFGDWKPLRYGAPIESDRDHSSLAQVALDDHEGSRTNRAGMLSSLSPAYSRLVTRRPQGSKACPPCCKNVWTSATASRLLLTRSCTSVCK